ncbi:MAG: T9SS type A sorting domain-containing protein [Bacteroidetes bacterium]|nr:T9SS type A sorting domain-containing protein [Bacteroidota bacterium]
MHSKTLACRKNNTTVLSWNYLPDSKTITILFREQPGNHTFIRLIDLQGRTIYHSESIQEKELVISTWQFPQGIYALEIEADNFHSTAKISIFN